MFVYVFTDYSKVEGCENLRAAKVFKYKKDALAWLEKRKAQILRMVPKYDIMTTYTHKDRYWSILTFGTGNGSDEYTLYFAKLKVKE